MPRLTFDLHLKSRVTGAFSAFLFCFSLFLPLKSRYSAEMCFLIICVLRIKKLATQNQNETNKKPINQERCNFNNSSVAGASTKQKFFFPTNLWIALNVVLLTGCLCVFIYFFSLLDNIESTSLHLVWFHGPVLLCRLNGITFLCCHSVCHVADNWCWSSLCPLSSLFQLSGGHIQTWGIVYLLPYSLSKMNVHRRSNGTQPGQADTFTCLIF